MDFKTYALSHQTDICLELGRVRALLEKSGSPDMKMKIIHVAGTNGKGSVCSFVCEGLKAMGKATGRFSSPELFDITDTITVNSIPITRHQLDAIYDRLAPLCAEVEASEGKAPSQFEINFVAALLYFQQCGCTHAVLECGMGGAGDATNAIHNSAISVITKISLDHMAYLGNTAQQIAANKCGIFKHDSRIITGAQSTEVMQTIVTMAEGRAVAVADKPRIMGVDAFSAIISYRDISDIKLSLAGIHQAENAAIAAEVLFALGADDKCIKYALENAANPARFEKIDDNVYFDGAHNPDGVARLVETINKSGVRGRIVFSVGFMADKDYTSALRCLKELDNQDFEIYAVPVLSNPRSETADNLCKCARSLGYRATAFGDIRSAIQEARTADWVFAFGSLYMYKEYSKR